MTEHNISSSKTLYSKLINLLRRFYSDAKKSMVLFLCCILFSTTLLLVYNYTQSKVYQSSFTVSYEEMIRKVYGDRLNKLNLLIDRKQTDQLSKYINVDKAIAANILKVDAVNLVGEDLVDDLNTDTIPFIVTIYSLDTIGLKRIQDGIVSYLETGNQYLAELNRLKVENIENEIQYIDRQLLLLDSLKIAYKANYNFNDGKSGAESSEHLYNISYKLFKKKQELIRKKALPSTLHVIDEVVTPVPEGHSYILLIILGVVIGKLLYMAIRYILIPVIKP